MKNRRVVFYRGSKELAEKLNAELLILDGESTLYADELTTDGKVVLCKPCIEHYLEENNLGEEKVRRLKKFEWLDYPEIVEVLIKKNGIVFVEVGINELEKAVKFFQLLSDLKDIIEGKASPLREVEEKKETSSLSVEVGSLHCALKHMSAVSEAVNEIFEKAISYSIIDNELIEISKEDKEIWNEFVELFRKHFSGDIIIDDVLQLIDRIRKFRARCMKWLYNNFNKIAKSGADKLLAFMQDYRNLPANLYHAEHHLREYAEELKKQNFECILCEEEWKE